MLLSADVRSDQPLAAPGSVFERLTGMVFSSTISENAPSSPSPPPPHAHSPLPGEPEFTERKLMVLTRRMKWRSKERCVSLSARADCTSFVLLYMLVVHLHMYVHFACLLFMYGIHVFPL